MYPDRLYELAFACRKAKLWKILTDSEIFALSLPDGETGYCCVTGLAGEHLSLALYTGDEGLDNLRILFDLHESEINPLRAQEMMLSQNCLQCSFESRDELSPEELSGVRAYARAHGITLRGANAFPQFVRYRASHVPTPAAGDEDAARLCALLEASLAVSEKLRDMPRETLGFLEAPPYDRAVPLLVPSDGGYVWSTRPLPARQPFTYPEPLWTDEILTVKLKKKKPRGLWLCDVMMLPMPAMDHSEDVAFPYSLLVVDADKGEAQSMNAVMDYTEGAGALLHELAEQMLESGVPEEIQVVDQRTCCLLKNLAAALQIRLTLQDENELLEGIEAQCLNSFARHMMFDEDGPDMLAHEAPSSPEEVLEQLCAMTGVEPDDEDASELLRLIKKMLE